MCYCAHCAKRLEDLPIYGAVPSIKSVVAHVLYVRTCEKEGVCVGGGERKHGKGGEEGGGRGAEMPSWLSPLHCRARFATRDAEHEIVMCIVMCSVSGSWRRKCKYPSNSYIQARVRTLTRCKVKRVCDLLPSRNTRRHRTGYFERNGETHQHEILWEVWPQIVAQRFQPLVAEVVIVQVDLLQALVARQHL